MPRGCNKKTGLRVLSVESLHAGGLLSSAHLVSTLIRRDVIVAGMAPEVINPSLLFHTAVLKGLVSIGKPLELSYFQDTA